MTTQTYLQWARDLLKVGGWPDTLSNEEFLVGWAQAEATLAQNNPLAITQNFGAPSSNFNKVGVKNFNGPKGYNDGLSGTVKFLNFHHYTGITRELAAGTGLEAATTYASEFDSPGGWGTGHALLQTRIRTTLAHWPASGNEPGNAFGQTKGFSITDVPGAIAAVPSNAAGQATSAASNALGSLTSSLGGDVKSVALFVTFLAGGIGLVVLGLKQFAQPALDRAEHFASTAATAGEMAAA